MIRAKNCMEYDALRDCFRMLWEQHVMWTRSFIISDVDKLQDLQYVTERLLKSPVDFANELRPFYGKESANAFKKLLTKHLLVAADWVDATIAEEAVKAKTADKQWYQNADEIATFLSSINPYWRADRWKDMFHEHLATTKTETITRLQGQYEENIKIYDGIENAALEMADYMAYGIMKQCKL